MTRFFLLSRLLRFRNEVLTLWRAFWLAGTPLYLKAAMIGVVLYLLSPADFIPEVVPVLGLVDDVILVPLMVSWIVSRLPRSAPAADQRPSPDRAPAKTIDGTARRL